MANPKLKKTLIHAISWILVAGIFIYVLSTIVPAEQAANLNLFQKVALALHMLGDSVAKASILPMCALILGYMTFLVFMDSAGTRFVIARFNCPITLAEMIPARAITFLLAVLNYQAGQIALPVYLKKVHAVPFFEGAGSIVFLGAVDLFFVFIMATCGSLFIREGNLAQQIMIVGLIGISGFIVHAWIWRHRKISEWMIRLLSRLPLIGKKFSSERSLFHAFQEARLQDYLKTLALRAPIHLAILGSLYLMIRCFHEQVPFSAILVYFPVVMVISLVPVINVGSVGASQASVVYFFREYASETTLFAVALIWAFAINALKVGLGAFFLSRHSADLFKEEKAA